MNGSKNWLLYNILFANLGIKLFISDILAIVLEL